MNEPYFGSSSEYEVSSDVKLDGDCELLVSHNGAGVLRGSLTRDAVDGVHETSSCREIQGDGSGARALSLQQVAWKQLQSRCGLYLHILPPFLMHHTVSCHFDLQLDSRRPEDWAHCAFAANQAQC